MRRPCSKNEKVASLGLHKEPNFYEMSKVNPLPEEPQNANEIAFLSSLPMHAVPQGICAQSAQARVLSEGALRNKTRSLLFKNWQARNYRDSLLFQNLDIMHKHQHGVRFATSSDRIDKSVFPLYTDSIAMDMALPPIRHLQSNHALVNTHDTQMNTLQESLRPFLYRPSTASLNSFSASTPLLDTVLQLEQRKEYLCSKIFKLSNQRQNL